MSRPKVPVNANRGKRLNKICEETKTTQARLSALTGISQQSISAMINGKANVTEVTARAVLEIFPQYRYEWLMNIDDYKYLWDKIQVVDNAVTALTKLCGYDIIDLTKCVGLDRDLIDDVIIKNGFLFMLKYEGHSVLITTDEWTALQSEIKDMVSLRLKYFFEQKERDDLKEDT